VSAIRVVASEVLHRVRRNRKIVVVYDGERVFKMSDYLVASSLFDWSPPVQLRIRKAENGTYELVARAVEPEASGASEGFGETGQ
jgi:hypothetical protein